MLFAQLLICSHWAYLFRRRLLFAFFLRSAKDRLPDCIKNAHEKILLPGSASREACIRSRQGKSVPVRL